MDLTLNLNRNRGTYRKRVRFADSMPFDTDPNGALTGGAGGESWFGGKKNSTGYQITADDPDDKAGLASIGGQIREAQSGLLGLHIVTTDPANEGGRTLVTTLPAGDYYFVTQPGGRVELWRFTGYDKAGTYPGTDLGNVSDGLRGGIKEAAGGARTTNPRTPSLGTRVGDAAAREARKVAETLHRINLVNADFWKPGGGAGVR